MNRLESIIENIYCNISLNNSSKYLYVPKFSNESIYRVNSRYRVTGVNYVPYKLEKSFYKRLFKSVIIIPNLHDFQGDDLIVESDNSFAVIYEPKKLNRLLFEGDITPLGLLAIRTMRSYGDLTFKKRVEDELSKIFCPYTHKNKLFLMYNNYDVEKLDDDMKSIFLRQNSFYWKD